MTVNWQDEAKRIEICSAMEIQRLRRVNDTLLAACKDALIVVELYYTGNCGAANTLRAAIAFAKENA